MSYHSWIDAVQSVKPLEVLEEAAASEIKAKLVAAGMGKMSKNERVSNQEPPLSNDQFVALIKKTITVDTLEFKNWKKKYKKYLDIGKK